MAHNYSKDSLLNAMFNCLSKKRIEKIQLSELLKEADVSKSTFYRYFRDKYDLMNQCYASVSEKMLASCSEATSFLEIIERQLAFYYENRRFFRNAFRISEESDSLLKYIIDYSFHYYVDLLCEKSGLSPLPMELQKAIRFYCYGSVNVLKEWIEIEPTTGYLDEAHIHYNLIPDIMKEYLDN